MDIHETYIRRTWGNGENLMKIQENRSYSNSLKFVGRCLVLCPSISKIRINLIIYSHDQHTKFYMTPPYCTVFEDSITAVPVETSPIPFLLSY